MNRYPRHTSEYWAWRDIKKRCLLEKNPYYYNYGGRGITICEEWKNDFDSFMDSIGPKPSPEYSIDRINNNGNYEPGNVKWSTKSEQDNNRRSNVVIEFNGYRKNIKQWATHLGVRPDLLRYYLLKGLNPYQAAKKCK